MSYYNTCIVHGNFSFFKYKKNRMMGIFKKTNPVPEIKPRIKIAGVPTEHFFLFNRASRENKCSVGTPAILIRGLISGPGFVFLNMPINVFDLLLRNAHRESLHKSKANVICLVFVFTARHALGSNACK